MHNRSQAEAVVNMQLECRKLVLVPPIPQMLRYPDSCVFAPFILFLSAAPTDSNTYKSSGYRCMDTSEKLKQEQ